MIRRKSVLGMMLASSLMGAGLLSAEPAKLVAFGDSLTQGYGLPAEDGLVPNLEVWLREQGQDVEILNAGVSGDTTAGGLSRIAWTLSENVDAIIVALGGNDVLRGLDPAVSKANLKSILEVVTQQSIPVLLVGMRAPNNFGPDYKAAFDPIYETLSQEYRALYYPSFFDVFEAMGLTPDQTLGFLQADRIHPNAKGVDAIVEGLGPVVLELLGQTEDVVN